MYEIIFLGYYRFLYPAGEKLPESAPGYMHCGTAGTGWLTEQHPVEVSV